MQNEPEVQHLLLVMSKEISEGWTVSLGFSTCLLRHTSCQGDPFSPVSCGLAAILEKEKAGKGKSDPLESCEFGTRHVL